MSENNSSYYGYRFKDGSDIETVNPLQGIAEIREAIVANQNSENTEATTMLLSIFAVLVSRAEETQVPFGSVISAINPAEAREAAASKEDVSVGNLEVLDYSVGSQLFSEGISHFNKNSVRHLGEGDKVTLKEGSVISLDGNYYRVKSAVETQIVVPFGGDGFGYEQASVEMFGDSVAWITSNCVE